MSVLFLVWLQFGQFLSDFEDSHLILTRIVSQIWTFFRNEYRTIVAKNGDDFSLRH